MNAEILDSAIDVPPLDAGVHVVQGVTGDFYIGCELTRPGLRRVNDAARVPTFIGVRSRLVQGSAFFFTLPSGEE